jgi:predicted transcriptional regulator
MNTLSYVLSMASTEMLTLRIEQPLGRRLARLSKAMDRSKSWVVADALEKYLDDNHWQVEAIEAGVAAADAGDVVPHSQVKRLVRGLATERVVRRRGSK